MAPCSVLDTFGAVKPLAIFYYQNLPAPVHLIEIVNSSRFIEVSREIGLPGNSPVKTYIA